MRKAKIDRKTTETAIQCSLQLDGTGAYEIDTGCGFLNHMLELFARHARFDITMLCKGDIHVDDHHTVEDVGIVIGQALKQALGDCSGITRYGSFLLPMDEALVLVAVDISGRPSLSFALDLPTEKIGSFDTELVQEFFEALVRSAGFTLHLRQLAGGNSHHIAEAAFKGCAHALKQAVAVDPALGGEIPSTKGTLL